MSRERNRLSDLKIKAAKAGARLCDGDGLYFHATGPGRGSWVARKKHRGRQHYLGLGSYPAISIAIARKKRDEAFDALRAGKDPKQTRDKTTLDRFSTFREWSAEYVSKRGHLWGPKYKKRQQVWLNTYINPVIGDLLIPAIDTRRVHTLLYPLWHIKVRTAKGVQSLVEVIWDYAAVLMGHDGDNPARWRGKLDKLLVAPSEVQQPTHHPAIPYTDINLFFTRVIKRRSVSCRALAVIILTAVRVGMAAGAQRKEFDLENKVWTIPAERVKGVRAAFCVPLSTAIIVVLDLLNIRALAPDDYVFPNRESGGHLDGGAILSALKALDDRYTVHGLRATFRTWVAECTDFRPDVAEMALAHLVKAAEISKVSLEVWRAYQRGQMLEKRRILMSAWADVVTGQQEHGQAQTYSTSLPPFNNGEVRFTTSGSPHAEPRAFYNIHLDTSTLSQIVENHELPRTRSDVSGVLRTREPYVNRDQKRAIQPKPDMHPHSGSGSARTSRRSVKRKVSGPVSGAGTQGPARCDNGSRYTRLLNDRSWPLCIKAASYLIGVN
jgi:integrase